MSWARMWSLVLLAAPTVRADGAQASATAEVVEAAIAVAVSEDGVVTVSCHPECGDALAFVEINGALIALVPGRNALDEAEPRQMLAGRSP